MKIKLETNHAHKAVSYDIGRPDYPGEFFDFFYADYTARRKLTIADIGAGTGKQTKSFLTNGSLVYAVEPDIEMMDILRKKTDGFANRILLPNRAEVTGIPDDSVDMIFCGNSYHWFDRVKTILEFKRIVKRNGAAKNIMIANLGADKTESENELYEELRRYQKNSPEETARLKSHFHEGDCIANLKSPFREGDYITKIKSPFREGAYIKKDFKFNVNEGLDEFMHGILSASYSPSPFDTCYDDYRRVIENHFYKHCRGGKHTVVFTLSCMAGNVDDLYAD